MVGGAIIKHANRAMQDIRQRAAEDINFRGNAPLYWNRLTGAVGPWLFNFSLWGGRRRRPLHLFGAISPFRSIGVGALHYAFGYGAHHLMVALLG